MTAVTANRRGWPWFLGAGLLLAAVVVFGAMIGPAGNLSSASWNIIWNVRLPRVALAAVVGAMLSVAGAAYQGVFRNPLVDPYLLGAAGGAGLGATIVIAFGRGSTKGWFVDPLPLAAFLGATAAVSITYLVGAAFGAMRSTTTLVLAGVAVASLTAAIQAFILQRQSDGVVRAVYNWLLGSLTTASWRDVVLVLPYIVVSAVVLLLHRRHLDLLRVGDEEALTLGMDVRRVRIVIVVAATIGTAAVVSVSGLITFVGIVVPHAVRMVFGGSYRRVLPVCLVVGAAFLILADVPGRMLQNPNETPIGVVTAFCGAPFFILLLRSRRGRV